MGSVTIGGLSPFLTGDSFGIIHIVSIVFGIVCGTFCAYCANYIMKFNGSIFVFQCNNAIDEYSFVCLFKVQKWTKMVEKFVMDMIRVIF